VIWLLVGGNGSSILPFPSPLRKPRQHVAGTTNAHAPQEHQLRKDKKMSETKTMSGQPVAYDGQTRAGRAGPSYQEAEIGITIPSPPSRGRQILRFVRHFGEMMLAMLLGMAVFDVVDGAIHIPVRPEVSALAMAVAMTVPMVAWMRIRKHTWRLNAEMAGAMIVPTVLLIGVCELGLLPRTSLMLGTHILMVPAMLAVMLYRWRDYTCH
jgi:hypothetical protein